MNITRLNRSLLSLLVLAASVLAGAEPMPLSSFELEPAVGSQTSPAVAAGPRGFLAVWLDGRNGPAGQRPAELRATRLDENGSPLDRIGTVIEPGRPGTGPSEPRVFWNGESWLVLYLKGDALIAARIDTSGAIDQLPRIVFSGPANPVYSWDAFAGTGGIVVTGIAANGASMLIVDDRGSLIGGPWVVEKGTQQQPLWAVAGTTSGDEIVLVTVSESSCPNCIGAVAHRIAFDGSILKRRELPGIGTTFRRFAIAPRGNDYLLVGQRNDAVVESWTLTATQLADSYPTVVSGLRTYSYFSGSLEFLPREGGTDLFFFAPREDQGDPVLHRARFDAPGGVTNAPFGIPGNASFAIAVAEGDASVVALTGTYAPDYSSDLFVRAAPSVDLLPQSTAKDITFSAPSQSDMRAFRRLDETLVTWVEKTRTDSTAERFARRVDASGKPFGDPVVLFAASVPFSIATDGLDYLVARHNGSAIEGRRLRADLSWRDPVWQHLVTDACTIPDVPSVTWDGAGWWIGVANCEGSLAPVVRRFDQELRALTPTIELETIDFDGGAPPFFVPLDDSLLVLWRSSDPPCYICTCVPAILNLFGTRLGLDGSVLIPTRLVTGNIESGFTALGWNGTELLAISSGSGYPTATRISRELEALDVSEDDWGLHGVQLDDRGLGHISIGWDGSAWVTAALTYHPTLWGRFSLDYRRFPSTGELSQAWQGAETRNLGSGRGWPGDTAISAAPGTATLLIMPLASEETTGVARYYVRNMSDSPRRRGVRP